MKYNKSDFLKNATITKEIEQGANILKIEIFDDLFYICEDGLFCTIPAYLKLTYLKYNGLVKFAN